MEQQHIADRLITNEDRDLLNEALSVETQIAHIDAEIKYYRQLIEVKERVFGTLRTVKTIQFNEIKKRKLETAHRIQLKNAGISK